MGLGSEDSEQLGSLLGRDRAVVVLPTKARLSEHQLEKVRLRLQVCPEVSPLRPAALSPEARAKLAEDLGVLRRAQPCSELGPVWSSASWRRRGWRSTAAPWNWSPVAERGKVAECCRALPRLSALLERARRCATASSSCRTQSFHWEFFSLLFPAR